MINEVQHIVYKVRDVAPYINWPYFDYAWGVGSKGVDERRKIRKDASALLDELDGSYQTHALFGIFVANSDGDDLLLGEVRIPMLRQQRPSRKGQPCLCLADFVRPLASGKQDEVGVFATTVDSALEHDFSGSDPYRKMLVQTVADRLAEATAEDASGSAHPLLGICSR